LRVYRALEKIGRYPGMDVQKKEAWASLPVLEKMLELKFPNLSV